MRRRTVGRSRTRVQRRRIEAETVPPLPCTAVSGRAPSRALVARRPFGVAESARWVTASASTWAAPSPTWSSPAGTDGSCSTSTRPRRTTSPRARPAAPRRMQRQGVESLAVVLLFSFVNPAHERRVRAIAAEELPGAMVSLSHEVMPSAPEFERTSTTLVNAYLGPKIGRYLSRLDERLRAAGFAGELLIMQSNGGVMPGGYVAEKAVAVMGSGPAGGVNGATAVAGQAGIRDFISVDMGGTSYDVCLVRGGAPDVKAGWNWHHRYLIGLPMVDVQSVGAGGGSIARVESGALRVGPESAGAEPGPVCYGRGGVEPTVTDANLVLGYLNPGSFCGGTMRLDVEGALAAIRERVAKPLGVPVVEAAE